MKFLSKKYLINLFFIFLLALLIRFLYFPGDIYFGFDQARDAFATKEILSGHLKLIGPPTTSEGLRHGVLYYYLYAPFYFFGNGNPAVVAAFLRVANSLGVLLIFAIAAVLFNRYVGLIAAFLFAISFEQTQFAMYLNHPSLAVLSILILYLGLVIFIFKQKNAGLILASLGLGFSVQFEFLLTYLIPTFLIFLIAFKNSLKQLNKTTIFLSLAALVTIVSTFLIAEFRYNFRSINFLLQLLLLHSEKSIFKLVNFYLFEMGQMIKFNFIGDFPVKILIGVILFISFILLLKFGNLKKQIIFLGLWFFSAILIYFVMGGQDTSMEIIQYHPNVGIALSLIIFVSFLIYLLGKKNIILALLVVVFISLGNSFLIREYNPSGSIPELNAQSFMLLFDEEKVVDFIYQDAGKKPFAVKAITMPFYINTTWSYIFSWYGLQKYGYTPVWNGKNALGFPNNLIVDDAQDKSPDKRYLIIEPVRGIPTNLINGFLKEESYFTSIDREVNIGKFVVQVRSKKV